VKAAPAISDSQCARGPDHRAAQARCRRPALLLAFIKTTTDLERIGDEAKKIALRCEPSRRTAGRRARATSRSPAWRAWRSSWCARRPERWSGSMPARRRRRARESELDAALRGVVRELITYMIEDPRTISACLDMLFVAKSFERIGDHATNVLEHVVYAVRGEDLRMPGRFLPEGKHGAGRGDIPVTLKS